MKCVVVCVLFAVVSSPSLAAPDSKEWFIPARWNYGTWGQPPEEDFPDGDIDAQFGKMSRIGMRDYFMMRGDEALRRQIYAAAEKHGVRVWLRTFGQAGYSEEDAKAHPERLFQMDWTKAQRIACLSWPENQVEWIAWTEPMLLEEREHLHGVNLDFIRYPDDSPCLCEACRVLHKEWLGREEVTEEDLLNEVFAKKYAEMRNSVIGGMVQRVRTMCDHAGLKLSVCVFANLDHARMLGQDWPRWAREGLVDVVCPMSYTSDRAQHQQWLHDHVAAMDNQAELWDSVARVWDRGENEPGEVLAQSLNVLRSGAHGLVSFNMAAFSEEDWRLQADLQAESGWRIALDGQTLRVDGPPLAWMRFPSWPVTTCVVSGSERAPLTEDGQMIVRGPHVWMETMDTSLTSGPGQPVTCEIMLHNWSPEDAAIRVKARLPEGWDIDEAEGLWHVAAGQSQTVAVVVRTAESASPGRYWVDIMAEDIQSGHPVPRPCGIAARDAADTSFALLALTRTRFTSAPTWISLDITTSATE